MTETLRINPQEVDGVFNSLLRLSSALQSNNEQDIERAMALLDQDFDRINFTRAEVGFRGRNLDALKSRIDDETNQVKDSPKRSTPTTPLPSPASPLARRHSKPRCGSQRRFHK